MLLPCERAEKTRALGAQTFAARPWLAREEVDQWGSRMPMLLVCECVELGSKSP